MRLTFPKSFFLLGLLYPLFLGEIFSGCASPTPKVPPQALASPPQPKKVFKSTVSRKKLVMKVTSPSPTPEPIASPTPSFIALPPVHYGPKSKLLDQQARLLQSLAEIQRTREGIVVILKSDDLFEKRDKFLKAKFVPQLDRIGDILASYPTDRVIVAAHTDNQDDDETAQKLSENQASAVRTQLLTHPIPQKHITAVGMGKSQPIATNSTVEGKTQNRRLEIRITCK